MTTSELKKEILEIKQTNIEAYLMGILGHVKGCDAPKLPCDCGRDESIKTIVSWFMSLITSQQEELIEKIENKLLLKDNGLKYPEVITYLEDLKLVLKDMEKKC